MNYCCDSQSDYINLLKQNENNYQEELREKYNHDNKLKKNNQVQHIMQDTISNEVINDNVTMVEYKESFFKKFIDKIKTMFHIN